MKKLEVILFACLVSACAQYRSIEKYRLEKAPGYDVAVCIGYSHVVRENASWMDIGGADRHKTEDVDLKDMERQVVPYSYCLERLPKQVHLVEKKEKDMTICYDRNNKVELPILYCQKDVNVSQTVYIR